MRGIDKIYRSFGREIHALKKAELTVRKGTVHGLLGENGAGKSTLMKILAGVEKKNGGEIYFQGRAIDVKNAVQATRLGIGMVHQHFSLLDEYTVAQNVVLGMEPTRFLGFVDERVAREGARKAAARCGFDIDLDAKVGSLSMGQRQKVEIMRILYSEVDLLIFDEPTSVLVEQEIRGLLETIRMLKEQGKTIVYISHKVEEVMAITDEVTVLRNGITVQTGETASLSPSEMVRMMVGKELSLDVTRPPRAAGAPLLTVERLSVKNGLVDALRGVSFDVREGEIVAVAGINGNGQQELVEALFGLRAPHAGSVRMGDTDITGLTPIKRRRLGMGYIPEDRIHTGSCSTASVMENVLVDRYDRPPYSNKLGWLYAKPASRHARELIARYAIKAADENHAVGALSGGHIQRTILARELSANPRLLLACEVTMGLDVESTRYIHDSMLALRELSLGILLVSSNMGEILGLADRILVLHQGELTACLVNDGTLSREEIGAYMLGIKRMPGYGSGAKEAASHAS